MRRLLPTWHFGSPAVPAAAIVLSVIALSVPFLSATMLGGGTFRFEALVWLLALVPAFLFAFYRGWAGVASGLGLGLAVFSLAQVFLAVTGRRLPDWPLMMSITLAFVGVALILGALSDRLHAEREKAERLALFDSLTGVPNRRYIDLILEREFAAARRGRPLVVVAFDLDGLKPLNDRYGHAAGDAALVAFARVLAANTRAMDLSGRLGGDEFVSVLAASSVAGATVFVQRIQAAAEAVDTLPVEITVSAGIATYDPAMTGPGDVLEAADRALYRAKTTGPGRVVANGAGETSGAAGRAGEVRSTNGAGEVPAGAPPEEEPA